MLHVVGLILAVTVPWQAPRRTDFVVLQPLEPSDTIVYAPFGGTRPNRALGPRVMTKAPTPLEEDTTPPPQVIATAPVTPPAPTDTNALPAYDPDARLVPSPAVGDGRLWVSPRPALPSAVAEALYGKPAERDSVAARRLRAMVDSLNTVIDEEQRERRRPSWVVGGDNGSPKFGIDSQYIHVAGIKIPTTVLAFLGSVLPQGNFDEGLRARQLQNMREDLLRAADRAQTLKDFRRYVRELRERKQAERDAERRRRGDTTTVVP